MRAPLRRSSRQGEVRCGSRRWGSGVTRRPAVVRSLSRGLDLLETIARYDEVGLVELAERCELQNSTVHRLLATLVAGQYVATNPATGKYSLGQKVIELAGHAQSRTARIRALARPHMEELRDLTGECVDLVQLQETTAVSIEQVLGSSPVCVFSETRRAVPGYATAAGKVILAHGGGEMISQFQRAEPFVELTPSTARSTGALVECLPEIRRNGYAVGDEELEEGVICIAAPVIRQQGDAQLALGLSGPAPRLRRRGLEETGRLVREKAAAITQALAQDSPPEEVELLARAVSLAFDHELSETAIGEQLGVSRSKVSRLLGRARELGVVDLPRDVRLEGELLERFAEFGLTDASVLSTSKIGGEYALPMLGRLAAKHVESRMANEAVVGLGWGTAVHATVQAITTRQVRNVKVVQVIGAVGSTDPRIDGPDLARQFAERVGGSYFYIHAPLIVENAYVRETLMADRRTREALDLARAAPLALVGIGSVDHRASCLTRAGFMSSEELSEIAAQGSVGDFCGYQLDAAGRVMDLPINDRVVAVPVADLRAIPCVVAVAVGIAKAPTVVAALRGGFVEVVALTDVLAAQVLALADGAPPTSTRHAAGRGAAT